MRLLLIATAFLIALTGIPRAQQKTEPKYDVKRCVPKLLTKPPFPKPKRIQPRYGEKATGYSPIVAFNILESGEVVDAQLKRGTGLTDRDALALDAVRKWKFNSRPGCGTLAMQTSVQIHLEAENNSP